MPVARLPLNSNALGKQEHTRRAMNSQANWAVRLLGTRAWEVLQPREAVCRAAGSAGSRACEAGSQLSVEPGVGAPAGAKRITYRTPAGRIQHCPSLALMEFQGQ